MPLPQPLRLLQQCVDDSSDVGEAPSWGPLLFQDVVGLAQGLLGGGAQMKSPCIFSSGLPSPWQRAGERHPKGAWSKKADRMALKNVGEVRGTLDMVWDK